MSATALTRTRVAGARGLRGVRIDGLPTAHAPQSEPQRAVGSTRCFAPSAVADVIVIASTPASQARVERAPEELRGE
eukprot:15472229-Alexandrium_andersonii.AAC.1